MLLLSHNGRVPKLDPLAWVAPDATVCGDVHIGAGSRVLHGARIIAEAGGTIRIGENCIVMENAVVRATAKHTCTVSSHCLIGPNAHVVGATIEEEVFIATGAAIFHGAVLERGSEVRIHAIVHIKTRLTAGETVPIGWIAVGEPAVIRPPAYHDEIWAMQAPLDFPRWVYGVDRQAPNAMRDITSRLSRSLSAHMDDVPVALQPHWLSNGGH